ncbi:hypothetical protein CYY_002582 [Polysphondylium violaceum]|uniref:VIT domain-containing protein n=1 Tax=Polysphondylium violaceum TaxID=133409 RepID=A0A8J4PYL5_9MYCE|nr:hypothetical protein CYY_002582 [Polysphondylium violaceum]
MVELIINIFPVGGMEEEETESEDETIMGNRGQILSAQAIIHTVSDMVIKFDAKTIVAKIKERKKAEESYDDAIASGHQAFLGSNNNGVFELNLGNIPPDTKVTVSVTLVAEIGTHRDAYEFLVHKCLFPNYSFTFKLDLKINLSSPIKEVYTEAPHVVGMEIRQNRVNLCLPSNGSTMLITTIFVLPNIKKFLGSVRCRTKELIENRTTTNHHQMKSLFLVYILS